MKTRQKILGMVVDAGDDPPSTREIAAEVDRSHIVVWRHLNRLVRDGLLERGENGRVRAKR